MYSDNEDQAKGQEFFEAAVVLICCILAVVLLAVSAIIKKPVKNVYYKSEVSQCLSK